MKVRIVKLLKNPMQSGRRKLNKWCIIFQSNPKGSLETIDPIMGWQSSNIMQKQLSLSFETKEAAIAYAEKNHYAYEVVEPKQSSSPKRSYQDNFTAPLWKINSLVF